MKQCPNCGRRFNWWQRAIGEHREHLKGCKRPDSPEQAAFVSTGCRGCPANCFDKVDYSKERHG